MDGECSEGWEGWRHGPKEHVGEITGGPGYAGHVERIVVGRVLRDRPDLLVLIFRLVLILVLFPAPTPPPRPRQLLLPLLEHAPEPAQCDDAALLLLAALVLLVFGWLGKVHAWLARLFGARVGHVHVVDLRLGERLGGREAWRGRPGVRVLWLWGGGRLEEKRYICVRAKGGRWRP